ncbi:MAG: SDR family oxidoreductase [Saprospiraceae bacterium]|nr:SDR family oxidoreductase [Saprospiraceae bacterium]
MNLDLQSKTAMVCGSTQGIGYETAIQLANCGARVILVARNKDKLLDVVSQLPNPMNGHTFFVADFSNEDEVDALVAAISGFKPDILVNNTGGPPAGPVLTAQEDAFKSAFFSHLIVNHKLTCAAVPYMMEAGGGRIINIISTSVKQPLPNLGVSNTIRAAVANWAKTLANELAPYGITVNNVLPGATHTGRLESIINQRAGQKGVSASEIGDEMAHEIPMKRFGKPIEIASAVAFLASPLASYITGINLPVDGGRTSCL